MKIFEYNISEFKFDKVDLSLLKTEIINSQITISISKINQSGGFVYIHFLDDLPEKDITLLDEIVSEHTGEADYSEITYTKIKEEEMEGATHGHFQACVVDISTNGNETVIKDLEFPYAISLFSSEWLVGQESVGDIARFQMAPDTIVGYTTEDHYVGDNVFDISDTAVEFLDIGFHLYMEGQDLGRVISVNDADCSVTTEFGLSEDLVEGTYITTTIEIVPYWKFTSPGLCSVGESKIGASYIPPNTVLRLVYENINDITDDKVFGISIDYLY